MAMQSLLISYIIALAQVTSTPISGGNGVQSLRLIIVCKSLCERRMAII